MLPDVVNDSSAEVEANGVIIECSNPLFNPASTSRSNFGSKTWQSNVHPFAHRTQQRYAAKQQQMLNNNNNVSVTSATSVTLLNNENLDDSFDQILRSADHSLHQAESILSNLVRLQLFVYIFWAYGSQQLIVYIFI